MAWQSQVCVVLYLLSRYMRPGGQWQRQWVFSIYRFPGPGPAQLVVMGPPGRVRLRQRCDVTEADDVVEARDMVEAGEAGEDCLVMDIAGSQSAALFPRISAAFC